MIQASPAAVAPTASLQELVLAGHFQAPLPLGVTDAADWTIQFSDFPLIQQMPLLPTVSVPTPGPQHMAFELGIPTATVPRMLLRSPDGRNLLQLQPDRFAIGWARTEPLGAPAEYPGFNSMFATWEALLARFEAWAERRLHVRPQFRVLEISYVNAVPLKFEGKQRKISEVFRFFQAGGRPLTALNVNWAERIYPSEKFDPNENGLVSVSVGLSEAPPAIPVLVFNLSGLAPAIKGKENKQIMHDIHDKIRDIYKNAIVQNAD